MTPIDKIAWIRLEDGKILSTAITWERRHRTWQRHARGLTYADRDRVSPVDQLIFDDLHQNGLLS